MTDPNDFAWISDFEGMSVMLTRLIEQGSILSASYVVGILQTDLAERGHAPTRKDWPIPGEAAPEGWGVYAAVLRWFVDQEHWSRQPPSSSRSG